MAFKLHDALKDPDMRYPRVANRLLDLGMLLLVAGTFAMAAVVFGMIPADTYFGPTSTMFWAGFILLIASKFVADLKTVATKVREDNTPRLRRVK